MLLLFQNVIVKVEITIKLKVLLLLSGKYSFLLEIDLFRYVTGGLHESSKLCLCGSDNKG